MDQGAGKQADGRALRIDRRQADNALRPHLPGRLPVLAPGSLLLRSVLPARKLQTSSQQARAGGLRPPADRGRAATKAHLRCAIRVTRIPYSSKLPAKYEYIVTATTLPPSSAARQNAG